MSEFPKPIERPTNEMAEVIMRMATVCSRARALHKEGFRYATLEYTRDGEKVTPHIRKMHYVEDDRQDITAPFMVSVNSILENAGGIIFGGDGENGISPLVAPDGSKLGGINIYASSGSENMDPNITLTAYFYPQGFDGKRLKKELGDFEYHVKWARIHEYMYFGFSDEKLHNPHNWSAETVGYVVTVLENVITAVEDVHQNGRKEFAVLQLSPAGEVEGTIGKVSEVIHSPAPKGFFRRIFR